MPKLSPRNPVKLADVQRLMAEAVMRPLRRDEGMQTAWKDGSPAAEVAARIIKPNDRLSSFERSACLRRAAAGASPPPP